MGVSAAVVEALTENVPTRNRSPFTDHRRHRSVVWWEPRVVAKAMFSEFVNGWLGDAVLRQFVARTFREGLFPDRRGGSGVRGGSWISCHQGLGPYGARSSLALGRRTRVLHTCHASRRLAVTRREPAPEGAVLDAARAGRAVSRSSG